MNTYYLICIKICTTVYSIIKITTDLTILLHLYFKWTYPDPPHLIDTHLLLEVTIH